MICSDNIHICSHAHLGICYQKLYPCYKPHSKQSLHSMQLKHLVLVNSSPETSHNSSGSRKLQCQYVTQNGDLQDRKKLPTPTDPMLICKPRRHARQKENFLFHYQDTTSALRLLIQTEKKKFFFFLFNLKTKQAFTFRNIKYLLSITDYPKYC